MNSTLSFLHDSDGHAGQATTKKIRKQQHNNTGYCPESEYIMKKNMKKAFALIASIMMATIMMFSNMSMNTSAATNLTNT